MAMSAVLGPIHFWLYNKIGYQEQLTAAIAALAQNNGWIENADSYQKTLPPLETVIDQGNIHGWLQGQINDAETRFADLVMKVMEPDAQRLNDLCEAAEVFGKEHAIHPDTAEQAYKALDDFFLNGMPCDRVNALIESAEDHVYWQMSQDIHEQYWNNNSEPYYTIRKSVMNGMLEGSKYKLASDGVYYTILTR